MRENEKGDKRDQLRKSLPEKSQSPQFAEQGGER